MSRGANAGPSYFDGTKIGNTQKKFLWLAALVYFFDQMDNGTFSYAVPALIKNWGITTAQVAHVNSLNYFGMFLGAVFGGWLSDRIGRKKAMLTGILTFSLGSLGNAFATSFPVMAGARLVTGFGVVATVIVAMVYIAEMLPSENRGRYQSLTIACGTIGIPMCALFARWVVPMGPETWRYVFVLGSCGIFLALLGFFWFKESPRWLVSKGRIEEAENLVEEITGQKVDLRAVSIKEVKKVGNIEALRVMFSKEYIKRTLVLGTLGLGINLGIFFIGTFYTTMLTKIGLPVATVLTIAAISDWGSPAGDLTSSFFVDKGGRKIPIVVFCVIAGALSIVCGMSTLPILVVITLTVHRIFRAGSLVMFWSYLAESFPTHIRSNASGFVFGSGRLAAALSQFALPVLWANYGWAGLNTINGLFFILPAILVLFLGEKTSKRTLEELNEERTGSATA